MQHHGSLNGLPKAAHGFSRRRFLAGLSGSLALAGLTSPVLEASAAAVTLRAGPARAGLLLPPYGPTDVLAYNGMVPGPLIRARRGETVRVRLRNGLDEPTTIHWHGVRIDNRMDGVPDLTQSPVMPGEEFDYVFEVPDAGTFWYHPHLSAWEQVARGLHGLLLVDEDAPVAVDRDLVLVVDDWRMTRDGQIDVASFGQMHDWSHGGRLGNVMTVNGQSQPDIAVRSGERLRLRLCNVANSRTFRLRLDGLDPVLVSLDGQPVDPAPVGSRDIVLASGQRADLVVDMAGEPGSESPLTAVLRRNSVEAARFKYDERAPLAPQGRAGVSRLASNPLPTALDLAAAERVTLTLEGGAMGRMRGAMRGGRHMDIRSLLADGAVWALNGQAGMPEEPLFRVAAGRTVSLRMVNQTRWPHAMHFHGHHLAYLDGGRSDLDGWVPGRPWRDTVLVDRDDTVVLGFVADNPGRWMIHCHMLEHQAAGMATWFEVTGST